jgi:hypothetical protein
MPTYNTINFFANLTVTSITLGVKKFNLRLTALFPLCLLVHHSRMSHMN